MVLDFYLAVCPMGFLQLVQYDVQYIRYLYLYMYMDMYIIASWKTAGFRDDTTCVHCVASTVRQYDTVQKNQ